uniref:Uncharacterized protein n=1 Tax=Zea mays TaxID=4577 RepID=C4J1X4_MAIZE|nr:unknown [Zea mays]
MVHNPCSRGNHSNFLVVLKTFSMRVWYILCKAILLHKHQRNENIGCNQASCNENVIL